MQNILGRKYNSFKELWIFYCYLAGCILYFFKLLDYHKRNLLPLWLSNCFSSKILAFCV